MYQESISAYTHNGSVVRLQSPLLESLFLLFIQNFNQTETGRHGAELHYSAIGEVTVIRHAAAVAG